MPQSLASVPIHLIFGTKFRQPFITDDVRESLHRYMATAFKSCDSPAGMRGLIAFCTEGAR